jgi:hypothetical protein
MKIENVNFILKEENEDFLDQQIWTAMYKSVTTNKFSPRLILASWKLKPLFLKTFDNLRFQPESDYNVMNLKLVFTVLDDENKIELY